jgi:hypothetical protein
MHTSGAAWNNFVPALFSVWGKMAVLCGEQTRRRISAESAEFSAYLRGLEQQSRKRSPAPQIHGESEFGNLHLGIVPQKLL